MKAGKQDSSSSSSTSSILELLHHLSELLERDLAVTIRVNLLHDVIDCLLADCLSEAKDLLDFLCLNVTTAVLFYLNNS